MKQFKVGLQLYSIRDEMVKDIDATLKKVKEMGYDYVEFAGFYNHSAEEIKEILDKYELIAISAHQGFEPYFKKGQEAIDELKTIGVKYCAIPWFGLSNYAGEAEWQNTISKFTEYGTALKENGIQLMYHNHDFEFEMYDGKFILDRLYELMPAELLMPQIDTCWVCYAGQNPTDYIAKYSGRMKVLHLKDFTCKKFDGGPVYALIDNDGNEAEKATEQDNDFKFKPVGHGIQDFPAILKSAEEAGIDYVIVEQDEHPERSSLEDAKISREYLKSLGL